MDVNQLITEKHMLSESLTSTEYSHFEEDELPPLEAIIVTPSLSNIPQPVTVKAIKTFRDQQIEWEMCPPKVTCASKKSCWYVYVCTIYHFWCRLKIKHGDCH